MNYKNKTKKCQSSTNVIILTFIVLVVGVFIFGFKSFSSDLLESEHTNLNIQSKDYIANTLYGLDINTSEYQTKSTTQAPYLLEDESQSNKDYSLEFQYSKEKSESFWTIIFELYNMPYMFISLFRLDNIIPNWLISSINTFIWVLVTASIILFVRGLKW